MLREHVCRGAAADGDHVAGRHIFDGFLCDGVFEADVHLRLYREQRLAQQRAGGDGAAVHAFQQTLVGQIGDIATDSHGGNTQFFGQCGDTHRTAGTQPAQNQMLTL